RIRTKWEEDDDADGSREDYVETLARLLPETAFVVNMVEPARGGGHDGSVCFVAIDFASGVSTMEAVHRSLDVVGTTSGKVTLETTRQTAARKAAATKGVKGRRDAALKAARTRKRRAAAAKAHATMGPQGRHDAAVKAARTRNLNVAASKRSKT